IYGGYDHLVVEPMLRDKEYVYIGASIFIDWVYVDNIAFAHLLAEKELREGNAKVGGQAFNVTDNNPVWNVDFRERVIHYSGKKVQRKYAPYNLILMMGYAIHAGQSMLQHRFPRLQEPLSYLTLTALRIMNIDMVVRSKKAKSVLGYEPPFDLDEGIQLSIAEYEGGFNNSNMLLK
ncbi:3BETAHSD/D1, partial [Symbiodinium microadriaticum]